MATAKGPHLSPDTLARTSLLAVGPQQLPGATPAGPVAPPAPAEPGVPQEEGSEHNRPSSSPASDEEADYDVDEEEEEEERPAMPADANDYEQVVVKDCWDWCFFG